MANSPKQRAPLISIGALDLADALHVGIAAMVGGGVFTALALGADLAGPAVLVSLLVAGIVALVCGLACSSLAVAFPKAEGVYGAARQRAHPAVAHLIGWLSLAAQAAAAAAVAGVFAAYLAQHAPPNLQRAVAAGLIAALVALNCTGLKISLLVNGIFIGVALICLALFAGMSLPLVSKLNLRPFSPHGALGVLRAAGVLFFAYGGLARLSARPGELQESRKTIPAATALSVLIVMAAYFVVALGAVGTAGMIFSARDYLTGRPNDAPLLVAAAFTGQRNAEIIVTVGALVATASLLYGLLGNIGRAAREMAHGAGLPPVFSRTLPEAGIPWVALVVMGVAAAVLALTVPVASLIAAAAFLALLHYAGANGYATLEEESFGKGLFGAGAVACLVLAFCMEPPIIVAGLIVAAAGLVIFALRSLWRER